MRANAGGDFERRLGPGNVVVDTLRGLAAPHRAVPLVLVVATVLVAEWVTTREPLAVMTILVLSAAFCLLIPGAWRWLCSPRPSGSGQYLLGLSIYLLLCVALVYGFGLVLPSAVGVQTYVTHPSALQIITVLFAVGGWGLGRDIEMEAGLEAERTRAEAASLGAEHAQLLALRAQLDPHFLFNTLNAIAEWCRTDPVVAEEATLKLARILRTILEGIRGPTWSLERELGLLSELFEMYVIRDSERFQLHVDTPDPLPEIQVPPMILLPLFENAITHGPMAGHHGVVSLSLRVVADSLVVELRNPGAFGGRREGGHGIPTVEQRLALSYGGEASLDIRADGEETVTLVSVPLTTISEQGS